MRRVALLACAVSIVACGGAEPIGRTTGGPLREAPRARPPLPPVAAPPPRAPGRPYAATSLTPFAEAISDLAIAAADQRPLPAAPLLAGEIENAVEWQGEREDELEAIGFAMELEIVLKRGEPTVDAEGVTPWGSIEATIFLSRNGLRLVELRTHDVEPGLRGTAQPPTPELGQAAHELLAHLRAGDAETLLPDERDRQLIENDEIWSEIRGELPEHARLLAVAAMLRTLPEAPLSYRFDDVGVLARDSQGRLYGLELELEHEASEWALRREPLVRARRLWPR